jgi:dynein heavy chain
MVPPIKEAQKLLQTFVKNVAESSRTFVRWMDGTCIEMPDQRAKGDTDGDPLVMHFSSEVLRMQQVCDIQQHCHTSSTTMNLLACRVVMRN